MKPSSTRHFFWWNIGWATVFLVFATATYALEIYGKGFARDLTTSTLSMANDVRSSKDSEHVCESALWCMRQLTEWSGKAESWWPSNLVQLMLLAAAVMFLSVLFARDITKRTE
jgi:hypothetical protein